MKKPYSFTAIIITLLISVNSLAQENIIIETGLDPKMLNAGPYATSEHGELDLLLKVGYNHKKHRFGVFTERFSAIQFYVSGLFYDFQISQWKIGKSKIRLSQGMDFGMISRPKFDSNTLSVALNSHMSINLTKKINLKYTANLRHRSDLNHIYKDKKLFKFAGYLSLIYSIQI